MTEFEINRMCNTGKVPFNGRLFCVPEKWRRRYKEIWKACEYNRAQYRSEHDCDRKELTPKQVKDMMDERDRRLAEKKILKQKNACKGN